MCILILSNSYTDITLATYMVFSSFSCYTMYRVVPNLLLLIPTGTDQYGLKSQVKVSWYSYHGHTLLSADFLFLFIRPFSDHYPVTTKVWIKRRFKKLLTYCSIEQIRRITNTGCSKQLSCQFSFPFFPLPLYWEPVNYMLLFSGFVILKLSI